MPSLKIGPAFKNEEVVVRKMYKFSADGGALGAIDLFEAESDVVLTHFHPLVKVTCTSGGSATVSFGVTGTADLFVNTTAGAVANLTANALLSRDALADLPRRLPAASKVLMTIGTAALTAGEIEIVVKYMAA